LAIKIGKIEPKKIGFLLTTICEDYKYCPFVQSLVERWSMNFICNDIKTLKFFVKYSGGE